MSSILWLHLSNLHVRPYRNGLDSNRFLDSLIDDLQFMQKNKGVHITKGSKLHILQNNCAMLFFKIKSTKLSEIRFSKCRSNYA